MSSLDTEMETYRELLPQLVLQAGHHAVISGSQLIGVYESYATGLTEGYKKAGLAPFLVKRISRFERPLVVSRLL